MRNKRKRKTLKAIALSFATAAVFTGTAAGSQPEVPYLSHGQGIDSAVFGGVETTPGGVTPTNLARAVPRAPDGGVTPTDLARAVPRSTDGVTPTNLARAVPQYGPYGPLAGTKLVLTSPPAAVAATSGGYDFDDLAIGFGLGLILATACAAALVASRGRIRMAQA